MNESGKWTPELKLQAFKEIVTALMGLAVVGFTLWLAGAALSYAANDTQMSNAKDVLLLVLGISGVVIGYYFGRIPADARAAQANQTAQQATAAASVAADQIDGVLAEGAAVGGAGAQNGAGGRGQDDANAAAIAELRRVRDNLRSAARR